MLEVKLETLLSSAGKLSFVTAIGIGSPSHNPGVFPGLIAARAGHPIVGHAIETLVYSVAAEMNQAKYKAGEMTAYLSRFFSPDSLEICQMHRPLCPITVAVHWSLNHTSLHEPMELGVVSLSRHENALFFLVSGPPTWNE